MFCHSVTTTGPIYLELCTLSLSKIHHGYTLDWGLGRNVINLKLLNLQQWSMFNQYSGVTYSLLNLKIACNAHTS